MYYILSTAIQALIISGKAVQVVSKAGYLLPIARCLVTGRFLEVGKASSSSPLNPLIFPAQLIIGGLQMFQTNSNFKNVRGDIKNTQNLVNDGVANIREDISTVREDIKNVQFGVDTVISGLREVQYDVRGIAEGIKTVQQNLGVLQATTAIIGIGTVANIAISAASLHQILKLREDVREMRVEIKERV